MGTRITGDTPFTLGNDPERIANNTPPASSPAVVTPTPDGDAYRGGAVSVPVTANDTQESVARKAAYAHARSAGLSEAESAAFADWWTAQNRPADGKTYLYHLNGGSLKGFTEEEFAAVKQAGVWKDELNPAIHTRAVSDINSRLWNERNPAPDITVDDADVLRIDADPNTVTASQQGIDDAAQRRAEIDSKPLQATVDGGARKDGKPFDADTALGRYVQQTYNRDGRVWGDKINEVVSLAKLRGVKVENLQVGDDGRATFQISAEDKQKLDGLFAEALGETIKGEEAAARAREETQNMLLDFYKIQANGAVNVVNDATKLVGAPAIPKFEIKSEYWNKDGRKQVGEATTTITAALLSGKLGAVGRAINIGDTAASTTEAIVGEDLRTGQELSTEQRVLQGVTGAVTTPQASRDTVEFVDEFRRRATDARLRFPDLTAPQLATPDGLTFGVRQTADDLPTQRADDLVMESRANGFPGQRIPSENGSWAGDVGQSGWLSNKPEVLRVTGGKPVPFKDGFPDFSEWAVGKVEISDMKGNYSTDFTAADTRYAREQGWFKPDGMPDAKKVRELRETDNLTWHHHQDKKTMQLVPADLNNGIPHTGGASLVRKKGGQ